MKYSIECPETERTLIETINPFTPSKIRCEDCNTMHHYDECIILHGDMTIEPL